MKRFIFLVIVVLLAAVAVAQEWPDSVAGGYISHQEPSGIKMYLADVNDSPWVRSGEPGEYFWYGTVVFDDCHDEQIVELYLTMRADRVCDEGSCFRGTQIHDMRWWVRLTWDAGAGAYIVLGRHATDPTKWAAMVLTLNDGNEATFITGTVEVVGGEYAWMDDYPRYEYKIKPDIRIRRPGRRYRPIPRRK